MALYSLKQEDSDTHTDIEMQRASYFDVDACWLIGIRPLITERSRPGSVIDYLTSGISDQPILRESIDN